MKMKVSAVRMTVAVVACACACACGIVFAAEDPPSPVGSGAASFPKPYSAPCVERENVFAFTEKPAVKNLGNDKYEITFVAKGNCDVTVGIVDEKNVVVRHLASGVLGANAPAPFQKNSLKQTLYWNGKDDLDEYHKTPEKLKVRVMLGLKPEFDKLLGGTSPHNLPGRILGLAADPTGVYVFSIGVRSKLYIRKFGLDGRYLASLVPPPANLPEDKLAGLGYVEYEPGKRALHGTSVEQTITDHLIYPVGMLSRLANLQPVVVGKQLYFLNSGDVNAPSRIYRINTDGSAEAKGIAGVPFLLRSEHHSPMLAAAPDGQQLYMTAGQSGDGNSGYDPVVYRWATTFTGPGQGFLGDPRAVGSDENRFNKPMGLACDAMGRLYIADNFNNRLQVFSPEGSSVGGSAYGGKFLKSIPVDRPQYVAVHPKSGAIYVQHATRIEGRSVTRISKLKSWESPVVEAQVEGPWGPMVLDSWSVVPRLWFSNTMGFQGRADDTYASGRNVVEIWEESGKTFKKVFDFDEEFRKADGAIYVDKWWGGSALGGRVVCDPKRERVYFDNSSFYDLATGRFLGILVLPGTIDDFAFDKRGYMHCHFNPGFYQQGIGRLDPDRASPVGRQPNENPLNLPHFSLAEVPYDYGVEAKRGNWIGVLPVRDQPGAKFFQDGIGVNMRGDVAENCIIYNVPRMEDEARKAFGEIRRRDGGCTYNYSAFQLEMQQRARAGEETYFIKRQPGHPLAGATIWTFDRNGELRQECAAKIGEYIYGVQMDEDGALYFTAGRQGRTRMIAGRAFLEGRGGTFGEPDNKANRNPFTNTYIKSKGKDVNFLTPAAPIPLDQAPAKPMNLTGGWLEGAEWLYAGASPGVRVGCSCPTQRSHLDWYKRSYVPEQYRHSIGILDTNGNLIMHLGQYGNWDSGQGPKSKIPVNDGIVMSALRFVSGTDNYLCYEDNGERLVVLRLNDHAEETVGISNQ